MPAVLEAKIERIEARVSPEQKQLFERAAEVSGITLTDFAISSMQRAAAEALEQHTMLTLSMRDQRAFLDILLNPPAPSEALRRAAKRHDRLGKS